MSQRNPMNDRYMGEGPKGSTRRSAASAKPKSKAASTVIVKENKKTEKEKKAERKARQRKAAEEQRELDRKYYKPDTQRYKRLRVMWWVSLAIAVVFGILMFFTRELGWINIVCVVVAYGMIIVAFYIDFALIRKERRKYQERMLLLEEQDRKKQKSQPGERKQPTHKVQPKKVNKNATRNPAKQAEAARRNAEAAAAEAEGEADDAEVSADAAPRGFA